MAFFSVRHPLLLLKAPWVFHVLAVVGLDPGWFCVFQVFAVQKQRGGSGRGFYASWSAQPGGIVALHRACRTKGGLKKQSGPLLQSWFEQPAGNPHQLCESAVLSSLCVAA